MNPYQEHAARRYVETKYPDVRGPLRAMLVLTFRAGIGFGLKIAQDVIDTELKQIKIEWGIK